ncbi:ABC transporter G member 11 [Datura stramonium]|uniref:ABC transporter G member 11 n=1 Tax=Datura stramonium TaxID=4076 RepID=A0ABS8URB3_DATST|nr:ABC transporter G member 11 [Datura stramonium]
MRNLLSSSVITSSNDNVIMEIEETSEPQGRHGVVCAHLVWEDVNVMVTLNNGDTRNVLEGLTGYAEPGTFTALMGPSGSGKSTLLDALSGRLASNAILSGKVLLNGRKAKLSFGTAAYVTQDDTLIGTLTVRETIYYSAQLRFPDKMPLSEKRAMVESTIIEMGLQDCADTFIGNWHLRGISGGEKRRVSIALEILTRPRLLFLDEPTSGLDSASAFFVTQTLACLSRDGRTVIASIHQPNCEVFELFDRLYLLSGGKKFFAEAGFPCPSYRNPSDHFLRCINSDFDKVKATLRGPIKFDQYNDDPLNKMTTAEAIRSLVDFYGISQYCYLANEQVEEMSKVKGTVLDSRGSQASFFMQSCTLTKRSFVNMSRDFGYYWLRIVIYLVVSVCVGTIYFNVGTKYNSIQARGACAAFIFGFMTFMSIGGFPSFVEDMKVFQRERMNGHYGVIAFVIGNTLSAMPFLILIAILSGSICYFMVRFHPGFSHYLFFVLALYASITVVESLMMAIASVVPNFLMGIIIGAGILGISMAVSGFFRLPHDIPKPVWRYPVSYLTFDFWAVQGQYKNDLEGLIFDNQSFNLPKITGEYALKQIFQIEVNRSKWADLSVIFSMIIIYRVIFFIMIKIKEDVTPWLRGYIARKMQPRMLAIRIRQWHHVLLNGRKAKLSFGTAAYVTQDDTLIGTLTVREMIYYSAQLRFPDRILDIRETDTAEEKRRASIALEILTRPRFLFLDEPTSGLDRILWQCFGIHRNTDATLSVRSGRTVIASIHQPSSEIFEQFDRLFLLSEATVYFGQETSEARQARYISLQILMILAMYNNQIVFCELGFMSFFQEMYQIISSGASTPISTKLRQL